MDSSTTNDNTTTNEDTQVSSSSRKRAFDTDASSAHDTEEGYVNVKKQDVKDREEKENNANNGSEDIKREREGERQSEIICVSTATTATDKEEDSTQQDTHIDTDIRCAICFEPPSIDKVVVGHMCSVCKPNSWYVHTHTHTHSLFVYI